MAFVVTVAVRAPRLVYYSAVRGFHGAVIRKKCRGTDQVENAESRARLGVAADGSAGLLTRRSLVRAQVGEPLSRWFVSIVRSNCS
jgi:hypothetical protein